LENTGICPRDPDKQLAIIPTEHCPYFERYREAVRQGGLRFEGIAAMEKNGGAKCQS